MIVTDPIGPHIAVTCPGCREEHVTQCRIGEPGREPGAERSLVCPRCETLVLFTVPGLEVARRR
jgi:hypothetical protein